MTILAGQRRRRARSAAATRCRPGYRRGCQVRAFQRRGVRRRTYGPAVPFIVAELGANVPSTPIAAICAPHSSLFLATISSRGVFGVRVTRARAGTHDISPILRAGSLRSWAACNERVYGRRSRGCLIVPILIQGSSNRQRRSIQSARDDVCTQAPSIRINAPSKLGRKIDHMSRNRPRPLRARASHRPCARSSSRTGLLRPCSREGRANVTPPFGRAGLRCRHSCLM